MLAIDADSHFVEPLDLFERRIDARFRDRAYKVEKDPATGKRRLVVDNKPLRLLDAEELLSAISGYGQKESGHDLSSFDRDLPHSVEWQDMDRRVKFLDREGFAAQVIYPTVGLLWEAAVKDPALADALCRAYNTWALEICYSHKDRLIPAAHISLRDPGLGGARVESSRKARMPRGVCRGGALRRQKPGRSDLRSHMGRGAGPRPRGWAASGRPCPLPWKRILPRPRSRFHVGLNECNPGPPNSARHDGL